MKKIPGTLVCILLVAAASYAQGVVVTTECLQCPEPRPLPRPHPVPRVLKVQSVKVTTSIDTQVATTRVEQVFENESPFRLEGSYFFPIPDSASISDFAIFDGDKRMTGEVMEKAKAKSIYEEIVRKMIDPGLLEYAGKNLIQARVFPIEPRSTRKIEVTYTQVLKNDAGTVAYLYDLGVGKRMLTSPIGQISASVEIKSPVDLKSIFSPTHNISVTRDGERRARLSFEGRGEDAQKDFRLYYSLADSEFGLSLLTYREPGKDGYFLMLISPRVNVRERDLLAKDVVFVFDTSGSMSGDKIRQARAALRFGVESLSSSDRFNVISFSGDERLMSASLVAADQAGKKLGVDFAESLAASGGTNINDALVAALRQFQSTDRPRMLVFLTDGIPTVGTTAVDQILRNIREANRAGVRIFSFGVGYDVNTTLLDTISDQNKGTTEYIDPNEDLEIKVSSFFAKVNHPVLSELRLDLGSVQSDPMYPRELPDLFKGSQISLVGRYRNSAEAVTIRLSGNVGGRIETLTFDGRAFPSIATENSFLPKLWATRRVGFLLEQIRLNGANKELVDEVTELGTRFGIVTPYTSFLITEDMQQPGGRSIPRDARRRFEGLVAPSAGAVSETAVNRSRSEKALAGADLIDAAGSTYLSTVETVGSKTFILRDGVWVDTEYETSTRGERIKVEFGGPEFFELLKREPGLSEYLSVGQRVIVVYKGRVYEVTAKS